MSVKLPLAFPLHHRGLCCCSQPSFPSVSSLKPHVLHPSSATPVLPREPQTERVWEAGQSWGSFFSPLLSASGQLLFNRAKCLLCHIRLQGFYSVCSTLLFSQGSEHTHFMQEQNPIAGCDSSSSCLGSGTL